MLVSVVIPAFNARATIVLAIRSALEQAFDGEQFVIIYDDGSTDDTVAAVERELSGDARVRIMRANENGGASRHQTIYSMRLLGIGLPSSTPTTCSCQASWLCASALHSRMAAIW